jgi:hypothetical protein
MTKIKLTESELNAIIESSVRQVLEEGFIDQIKAGWSGLEQGVEGQRMLDRGTENFKQNWDRDDEAAIGNPWAKRPESTAPMQAMKAYKMYKEYQVMANKYLNLYNKLTKQYDLNQDGVGRRSSKQKVDKSAGVTPFRKPTHNNIPNAKGYNTVDDFHSQMA